MPLLATEYQTPQAGVISYPVGLIFPPSGGLIFDAGYPLTFPPDVPPDLRTLFPSYIPPVERLIFEAVENACSSRMIFPPDGQGITLPAPFGVVPDISLFAGLDPATYPAIMLPNGKLREIEPIPVIRGWPAYPGKIPSIGVAESTASGDPGEDIIQAGFAGDVFATDSLGNVLATASYYAEALHQSIIVELIHTNRDERDRLHDQLRRVIYPLRDILPGATSQIREVSISSEKQDLPVDEQPNVIYVSLYTVEVRSEALIATEIVPGGTITEIVTTINVDLPGSPTDPTNDPPAYPEPTNVLPDYT